MAFPRTASSRPRCYVVDAGGQQLTEVGANNSIWMHTNIYAGGKQIGTYDARGLHFYIDDPLGTRRVDRDERGAYIPKGQTSCTVFDRICAWSAAGRKSKCLRYSAMVSA
jgi:hypothetical protein